MESNWRYWGLGVVAAAVAAMVAAAALNTSPALLPPLVDHLPLQQQLLPEAEDISAGGKRIDKRDNEGAVSLPLLPTAADATVVQGAHHQSKPHRSLLGLLPFSLGHSLLPSEDFPFSAERPLQLHFVVFRRSKITAFFPWGSSANNDSGNANGSGTRLAGSSQKDTEQPQVHEASAATAATDASRFTAKLEPFSFTYRSPPLLRHSTQGVAVMGLGSQVFWNPAFADAPSVLSAMRNAVVAAEDEAAAAASASSSLSETHQTSSPPHTAVSGGLKHSNKNAVTLSDSGGEGTASGTTGKGTAAIERENICTSSEENRMSRCSKAKGPPAFLLMEEAPSQKAPLTLAHLHRLSTTRMHWSLYTNAQVLSITSAM